MQDWADRLDLLERGEVKTAGKHLTILIDGIPALGERPKVSGESVVNPWLGQKHGKGG